MSRAKISAVINKKGGAGKSTLSVNLSSGLVQLYGKKVLVIDTDSQSANATHYFGVKDQQKLEKTIFTLMSKLLPDDDVLDEDIDEETAKEHLMEEFRATVLKTEDGVDLIPANVLFAKMDKMLVLSQYNVAYVFRDMVEPLREYYDYIFVDCPPSLSSVVINVLSGVDSVLVPIEAADSSIEGLRDVLSVIRTTKRNQNRNLQIDGIVFTKVQKGTKASKKAIDTVTETYEGKVPIFETMIYSSTKMSECTGEGKSIFRYDPRSNAGENYKNLVKEYFDYAEES